MSDLSDFLTAENMEKLKDVPLGLVLRLAAALAGNPVTYVMTQPTLKIIDEPVKRGPGRPKKTPEIVATATGEGSRGKGTTTAKRRYGQPCQWRGCEKNLSPRTRPYCGEHYQKAEKKAEKKTEKELKAAPSAPAKKRGRPKKLKNGMEVKPETVATPAEG
jgi:hypothetical protein